MSPLRAALALALTACGAAPAPAGTADTLPTEHVPTDMPHATGPKEHDLKDCSTDPLGDLAWLPRDLRLAVVFDLDDPGVTQAAIELARASATTPGLPVVAALGLGFVDAQLAIVRRQLAVATLAPRELLLLHDPAGAVLWVVRARCDLDAVQTALADAWGLRSRASAAGPLAEPAPGAAFPHDVVFLGDDRLALVPAGSGGKLRRWLEGSSKPPELGPGPAGDAPGDTLAALAPAPIRVVLAGRGLLAGDAARSPRTLRAWPDRVELSAD